MLSRPGDPVGGKGSEPGEAGEAREAREVVDEMPTVPPAPKARPGALRWHSAAFGHLPPVADKPPIVDEPTEQLGAVHFEGGGPQAAEATKLRHEPRPRARRTSGARLAVVCAILAALAAGAAAAVLVVKSAPEQAPLAVLAKLPPAQALGRLLAAQSTAGSEASRAVRLACSDPRPASRSRAGLLAQLTRAEGASRAVSVMAGKLKARLALLPDGDALAGQLQRELTASLAADAAYQGWLDDLQATGCYSAPKNDVHYNEAQRSWAQAIANQTALSAALGRDRRAK